MTSRREKASQENKQPHFGATPGAWSINTEKAYNPLIGTTLALAGASASTQNQAFNAPLFACGVVLSIEKKENGKRDSRRFLAGLLDWVGGDQPTAGEIVGRRVAAYGYAHLKTITENGRTLLGEVEPSWPWPPELENLDNTPT